jgi:hypothetical protein
VSVRQPFVPWARKVQTGPVEDTDGVGGLAVNENWIIAVRNIGSRGRRHFNQPFQGSGLR